MSGYLIRNVKSVSWVQTLRRLATTGKNGEKMANIASAKLEPRARAEMERQYGNLLKQIGAVLKNPAAHGLGNIEGGSMEVQVRNALRKRLGVPLGHYEGLSPEYVKKSPRSIQYWRKTGALYGHYRAATAGKGKVRTVLGKLREQHVGGKSRYTQRVRFEFGKLPRPLDTVITSSFINGTPQHLLQTPHGYDRNSIGVIAYPEHFRPLLSTISAEMSKETAEGLRKALTGLSK